MTTSGAATDEHFVKMGEGVDGLADYVFSITNALETPLVLS